MHLYVTVLLSGNMLLILYALISVTGRMTLSGVGLIDSLPIGLYILPLLIFLPIMIRAFYRERTAAWNFVFMLICTVFYSLLSLLVRGFIIFLILNLIAQALIFVIGRFRPKGSLKKASKKGLVYIVLLNMLGLTFPISTVIMGQTSIASVSSHSPADIALEVPLASFDFPYTNLTPTPQLLAELESAGFSLDLHILEQDDASWDRLETWLVALNASVIEYSVTLTASATPPSEQISFLSTTESLLSVYSNHTDSLIQLASLLAALGISNGPSVVFFDMTLSRAHWQKLMLHTRALDLVGFSALMRASLFSVEPLEVQSAAIDLAELSESFALKSGVIVEPFVLDDLQDGDTIAMRLCGQTVYTLSLWDRIEVQCSRSRFSYEMLGDVGEYMVFSYAGSISHIGTKWTMRMGEIGNVTDISGRPNLVYGSLESLAQDLYLSAGSGVPSITLGSLSSLMTAFGVDAIAELRDSIDLVTQTSVTYTFRIYAFRAVFLAIDAFDFLMM